MKAFIKILLLLTGFTFFKKETPHDEFCGIKNTTFQVGEIVTMKVFYNALNVYVGAGEASFTTSLERFNGKIT